MHNMPPTCFGHSCGHSQGSALQGVHPMVHKICNISVCPFLVMHLPEEDHKWPKHVVVILCLCLHTLMGILFGSFTISN